MKQIIEYEEDRSMGPCVECGILGEDCDVQHTFCTGSDIGNDCEKVICDPCRETQQIQGGWTWLPENLDKPPFGSAGYDRDDNYDRDVCTDCATAYATAYQAAL